VIFIATPLAGAYVIEPESAADSRGLFARTWCHRELAARGLETRIAQCGSSFSKGKGTLRGMHYQVPPVAETKIVRCTRGSMYDLIIDLRPQSPTFSRHFSIVLSADDRKSVYVPTGFAHGFQTLEDDTEVFYQISEFYSPDHARGVRWDDPAFQIPWPPDNRTISQSDRTYPDFRARQSRQDAGDPGRAPQGELR
jgi:dTDP-4-dehydrorhamnose 3,5-epimerase